MIPIITIIATAVLMFILWFAERIALSLEQVEIERDLELESIYDHST